MKRPLFHERRCDCIACFGFRLATAMFLVGLGAMFVIGAVLAPASPTPLLVDAAAVPANAPPHEREITIPVDLTARAKFPKDEPVMVDLLAAVNRAVNGAIEPVTDQEHYGQDERFVAWPADGKGDCEDVALSKMELLGNMGFPLTGNAILLTVLVHHSGKVDGHAIVRLRLPHGDFMYLDMNADEPMTKRELEAAGYQFFDWSDDAPAQPKLIPAAPVRVPQ